MENINWETTPDEPSLEEKAIVPLELGQLEPPELPVPQGPIWPEAFNWEADPDEPHHTEFLGTGEIGPINITGTHFGTPILAVPTPTGQKLPPLSKMKSGAEGGFPMNPLMMMMLMGRGGGMSRMLPFLLMSGGLGAASGSLFGANGFNLSNITSMLNPGTLLPILMLSRGRISLQRMMMGSMLGGGLTGYLMAGAMGGSGRSFRRRATYYRPRYYRRPYRRWRR